MATKGRKSKSKEKVFSIDCTTPVEDMVLDLGNFEDFLRAKIKVDNKAGNLGDSVAIAREANKVSVRSKIPFSKRYLKYLTKKFLKKQQLRDYLRVIASDKSGYELKYYKISDGGDAEDDE
eukprot:CAMPEP_0185578028 /NCGR_PEP_ID=MMETSP0434-20130131/11743_1 /TAXON_ID=626734 ORGANISM="Favella taraikaensis, Strain Fe Narragansett Bay" /NCGR_SAMPLE_ID=MMETSP0434 /ASSEMBLY_ACC=CAM_ASM_000379 /LENGTH=120 /DNA_ID=CAMNT_0028195741 /DNA_START=26 /DNA_END=388 /DNA_ORIENTATION=+